MASYTVKSGDTLGEIAAANNMSLSELLDLNPAYKSNPNLIYAGATINLGGTGGGGTLTEAQVNAIFAEFGMDPNVHFDGTVEEGRAGRIAASGMTADDLRDTLRSAPGTGGREHDLLSVPGGADAEVWQIDGQSYLVYTVPGSQPPIYVGWLGLSQENIQAWFGPDQPIVYDRIMDDAGARSVGLIIAGSDVELANFDEDPFATWVQTLETQAKTQPWLLDDDYQAMLLEATLENRNLTPGEIQLTGWWQDHTESQRAWMKVYHGDPLTAQRMIEDNRMLATQMLKDAGIENASSSLITYMADQATMGNWSEVYFRQQVTAIADPHSGIEVDAGVLRLTSDQTGTTRQEEDTVKELVNKWLGPVYGAWETGLVEDWAGRLRNDPDAEIALVEQLQGQRMALFPEYEDRNVSYQDLAAPWRQFMQTQWGQKPDETDPLFQTLLKNNDANENGQLLIKEGLDRGVGKVVNDMNKAALRDPSGMVRRAV
jgi:hypothetical protein